MKLFNYESPTVYNIQMNSSLFLDNNLSQFIIRYKENQAQQTIHNNKPKPISFSSQISLPTHKKKKFRVNSTQIGSIKKSETKSPPHSLHTNPDQKKQQRDYSRVPIEYMQERDTGNPADRIRGRVVYRGYAPKNTYFYFKTIKELRFAQVTGRGDRDYRGEDISFNSKFESGNLSAAVRISSKEYWLYMREDTNTHGLRQWFYFEVRSRKATKIRMRIYRFTKKFSLYKLGMKPYIRTIDKDWHQNGEKILYEYDSTQKCYYLQFEYQFEQHKEVYFASLPPYTYSMMNSYLQAIATDSRVSVKKEGLSLSGLDIFSIKISGKRQEEQCHTQRQAKEYLQMRHTQHGKLKRNEKEAIVVLARTHPGQTVSNWSLQSFIQRILEKNQLTDYYNFYILPMVNPDGVFLGNHRTGVLGQDLNRNFNNYDLQYFPEIQIVQNFINRIMKKQKIAYLFDLHGHSAKKNIFVFGEESEIGSHKYLYSRIIPKIIADSIDSFKLDHCLFKASKEKTNTARVYFSKKYHLNAITFEQSYGLLETGCMGISNWKNFGTALADSLITYAELNKQRKDENIFYYLSDLMDAEKEAAVKILRRQQQRQRRAKQKEKQKQKQKEKEKEAEEQKQKLAVSKTEENEGLTSQFGKFLDKYAKKSEMRQEAPNLQIEQQVQIQNESLSSGDEDLEMRQNELQLIKKQIFRVGAINKDIFKRELYSMAEKKMQLGNEYAEYADYPRRLHHKNSAVVQRIFKFKSKKRGRQHEIPPSISERERSQRIQLPYIRK